MPNGIYPVPQFRSYPRRSTDTRPGIALRMRTRWKRRRLDAKLAKGANPAHSAELTLRAAQLRSPAARARFAKALVETLDEARRPQLFSLKLQSHRVEIRDCADDILALVERLRDDQPVDARGAALTARLLTAGASPLDPNSGESLRRAVRSARQALDAPVPTGQDLRRAA
jgi:hypothetical protein